MNVLAIRSGRESRVIGKDGKDLGAYVRHLRVSLPGIDSDLIMRSEIYCDRCEVVDGIARYPFSDLARVATALGLRLETPAHTTCHPDSWTGLVVNGWLEVCRGEFMLSPVSAPGDAVNLPFTSAEVEVGAGDPVRVWLRYANHAVCVAHDFTEPLFRRIVAAMRYRIVEAA